VGVRFTGDVLEQNTASQMLVEVEETVLGCETLLPEDVEVEAHLEDGEPLGDGSPQFAQQRAVHEVKVVDCVAADVRLKCS
jgi:hypothetical protein